jgi:peptidoglycan/xylan/chitin deacetylase (PgdA/CDA1 family)
LNWHISTAFVAATVGAAGQMAWAVRGRSSQVFGPSAWRGPRDRRALALTFDDGPSESTPRVLEALDRYRAPATFFQCGANVERLPSVASAVSAAGHEIGNHSYSHPLLCFQPRAFVEADLARAQQAIGEATGSAPMLFRAPFGVRWFGLGKTLRGLGLRSVMWTAIGRDWKLPAAEIAARLSASAVNGAILCLHDGRELAPNPDIRATIDALGTLLPLLRDRGFEFQTVSQLLCPNN